MNAIKTTKTNNFVFRRILGQEKKRRVRTRVAIEEELLTSVQMQCLDLNDVINLSVNQFLQDRQIPNKS